MYHRAGRCKRFLQRRLLPAHGDIDLAHASDSACHSPTERLDICLIENQLVYLSTFMYRPRKGETGLRCPLPLTLMQEMAAAQVSVEALFQDERLSNWHSNL